MTNLDYIEGEPPMGYSMVTMDELPMLPMLWFCNAVRRGDTKPYLLTFTNGMYVLWVLKAKNDKAGKVGWKTTIVPK